MKIRKIALICRIIAIVLKLRIFYHPVHGGWRDDEEFSECSEVCGGGIQTKIKYCDNPTPEGGNLCPCNPSDDKEISCNGTIATLQQSCNDEPCQGMLFKLYPTAIN